MPVENEQETETEKLNARQFPRAYYARHMQPGICVYNDETILVDADHMKAMAPSFVGKPVYIGHQPVDLAKLKEQAAGYISDSFYNELDGWLWVKFVAIDDTAHDAIQRGWAVSNAYVPLQWDDKPGTWHNAPYNRQILAGEFTHLAIVPDPRYERACIFSPDGFKSYQAEQKEKLNELQNSKKEPKPMFNLFKNKREAVTADKVDADTMVELPDGSSVLLSEMVNSVSAARAAEKKNESDEAAKKAEEERMNSEIEVGDEKMPLKELISRYSQLTAKKNEAEGDEGDEKKNADDEEAKKKAEEEKANSLAAEEAAKKAAEAIARAEGKKSFEELKNANQKATVSRPVESSLDKVARGASRYGSGK